MAINNTFLFKESHSQYEKEDASTIAANLLPATEVFPTIDGDVMLKWAKVGHSKQLQTSPLLTLGVRIFFLLLIPIVLDATMTITTVSWAGGCILATLVVATQGFHV